MCYGSRETEGHEMSRRRENESTGMAMRKVRRWSKTDSFANM